MKNDVLITGGTVIDPASSTSKPLDVAIQNGRIAALGDQADRGSAEVSIDATGLFVVPGLIDLHTHVYKDVSMFGIEADDLCPRTGVTSVVDAGTAGSINFRGLERYVIEPSQTRILAFVNLSAVGIPWRKGEMVCPAYIQPEACAETVTRHPETALGVKVRLYPGVAGPRELHEILDLAVAAASDCAKPLMVHISNGEISVDDILSQLRPGDIITHCFRGGPEATLMEPDGAVKESVLRARDKGIIFDIGHGMGSFSFDECRRALDRGFAPDTISSDIHSLCIHGPVFDLPTTMSKFLNLGMSLDEIVRLTTLEPAKVIGKAEMLGSLNVGTTADVTLLAVREESVELKDAQGEVVVGDRRIVCKAAIKDGAIWWHDDDFDFG